MIFLTTIINSLNEKNNNNYEVVVRGEPTNEAEYNTNVDFVSGEDDDGTAIFYETKPYTWSEVSAEKVLLQTEYDNNQYQRDRAKAYPSLKEQMDMQYWDSVNGTTTWKDKIAEIKALYPKPTENN